MAASQSPTQALKAWGPTSQYTLREKHWVTPVSLLLFHPPWSPSLWPSISLSGLQSHFEFSKPWRLLWLSLALLLPDMVGLSHGGSAAYWAPDRRAVAGPCCVSQYMASPKWEPTLGLIDWNQFPCFNDWELCHSSTPVFLLPWESCDTLSYRGFYPALPPEHLLVWFIFWSIASDLFLCTSYLTEVVSICSCSCSFLRFVIEFAGVQNVLTAIKLNSWDQKKPKFSYSSAILDLLRDVNF